MRRMHVGIRVGDLRKSRDFYTRLFGQAPSFERSDYAKWMLDDPYINLSLIERPGTPGLHHIGFQLEDAQALQAMRDMLGQSGLATADENDLVCGYHLQDKTWVSDPQQVAIEFFHSRGVAGEFGQVTEDGAARRALRDVDAPAPPAVPGLTIRALSPADAPRVLEIYQQGIDTGHATFAGAAGDWGDWDRGHLDAARLVAERDGDVVGWAALSGTSDRCVYGGVAEVSLYVSGAARGQGVGGMLLQALVAASEAAGFWTLQAGVFPENSGSLRLHQGCGFRLVGRRERIGRMSHGPMAGKWRDTLLLERRSAQPEA